MIIGLYVPSTDRLGKISEADHQARTVAIKRRFADWFGGYTVVPGQGGWVDGSGSLVEEFVLIVRSAVDSDDVTAAAAKVRALAAEMAQEWQQDAVTVEVAGDSAMTFVTPV